MSTDVLDQNHKSILDLIIKVNAEVNDKVLTYAEAYQVMTSFDFETFLDITGSKGDYMAIEMTLRHVLGQSQMSTVDVLADDRRHLARNLQDLIVEKETTVLKLSDKANVSVGTITRILEGATVDFGIYQRLMEALGRKFLFVPVKEFVHRSVNDGKIFFGDPPEQWEMYVENLSWEVFRNIVVSSNGLSPQKKFAATCDLVEFEAVSDDHVKIKGKAVRDIIEEGFYSMVQVRPTPEQYEQIKSIGLIHSGNEVLTVCTGTAKYKVTAGNLISPSGARLRIPLELDSTGERVENVRLVIDWDGEELVPGQEILLDYSDMLLFDTYDDAMNYVPEPVDPFKEYFDLINNFELETITVETVSNELEEILGEERYGNVANVIPLGENKFEVVVELNGVKKSKIITVQATGNTSEQDAAIELDRLEGKLLTGDIVADTSSEEDVETAIKAHLGDDGVSVTSIVSVTDTEHKVTFSVTVNEEDFTREVTVEISIQSDLDGISVANVLSNVETSLDDKEYEDFDEGTTVQGELGSFESDGVSLEVESVTKVDGQVPDTYEVTVKGTKGSVSDTVSITVTHDNPTLQAERKLDEILATLPEELEVDENTVEAVEAAVVAALEAANHETNITDVSDNGNGTYTIEFTEGEVTRTAILTVKLVEDEG